MSSLSECRRSQGRSGSLRALLATTALLATGSPAAAAVVDRARRAPVARHLASAEPSASIDIRRRVASSLGLIATKVPEEGAAPGEEKQAEAEQAAQPVTMQVPEKELEAISKKLSSRCMVQFQDMLHGKSQLHTFGNSGTATEGDCSRLNGGICTLDAHLTQEKAVSGRSMQSTTKVSGNSCLPRDCMAGSDLQVLTDFMKVKAQDTLPGMDVDIHMRVDCSKSGGSIATIGESPTGISSITSGAASIGDSAAAAAPHTGSLGDPSRHSAAAPRAMGLAATAASVLVAAVFALGPM